MVDAFIYKIFLISYLSSVISFEKNAKNVEKYSVDKFIHYNLAEYTNLLTLNSIAKITKENDGTSVLFTYILSIREKTCVRLHLKDRHGVSKTLSSFVHGRRFFRDLLHTLTFLSIILLLGKFIV